MFVGRKAELQLLNRCYEREGNQILVVYGEKGVGKTGLLKEFTQNKKSSYYAARPCSGREQRYQWASELKEQGSELEEYPEYRELFGILLPEITEKQVLVLDEFHHLMKGEEDFFGEMVQFLEYRRMSRPVMVVLASSATGWVENHLAERIGGNAAYINELMKVRELPFGEMRELFPTFAMKDCIQIYAVLGGIPGLWRCFDPALTARENLVRHLLAKESRLYGEMSLYLAEELREPAVYNTILGAIARDCSKLNDIYLHTGFSRAKISVYLKNLMELDLVEKVYAGIYRIVNPYVRFYFRFLFPEMSLLEKLSPEEFYERKVEDLLPAYVNTEYGRICRQLCSQELTENAVVSEWTGKGARLDIVAVDGNNRRIAALCSYNKEMGMEDYKRLRACARKAGVQVDLARLYSEAGFSEALKREAARGRVELKSLLADTGEDEIVNI